MGRPCLKCGARCANFRVGFYRAEIDADPEGRVPKAPTVPVTQHFVAMRGKEQRSSRRVALQGAIGQLPP